MKKSLKICMCLVLMVSILITSTVSVFASPDKSISVYLQDYTKINIVGKGALAGAATGIIGAFGSDKGSKVTYDNISRKRMSFDEEPQIIDGRTYVPIRAIAEELGYTVSWDGANQCVILSTVIDTAASRYEDVIQYERFIDLFKDLQTAGTQKKFTRLSGINKYSSTGDVQYIIDNYPHLEVKIKMYIGNNRSILSVTPHSSRSTIGTSKTGIVSTHTADCAATIINGRTLVPLRTVSELLGLDIKWNGDTRTIQISGVLID